MSVVIASDIHGSAYYCEKLLALYREIGAERLFLLGDILYHGPRNALPEGYAPAKVVEALSPFAEKITAVRGNCDAEIDDAVLPFDLLTPEKRAEYGGKRILLTHGHRISFREPPEESVMRETDLVFFGHSHVPFFGKIGKTFFCNPGSLSIPKENSRHAFAVMDENGIRRMDTDGNIFEKIGF